MNTNKHLSKHTTQIQILHTNIHIHHAHTTSTIPPLPQTLKKIEKAEGRRAETNKKKQKNRPHT